MSDAMGAISTLLLAGGGFALSYFLIRRFGKNEPLATPSAVATEDSSSGVDAQRTLVLSSNAVRVKTTDDSVTIHSKPDIASEVIARLSNGVDLWLGDAIVFGEREWMEAAAGSNTGYVLAPTVRSHTNLLDPNAEFSRRLSQAEPVTKVCLRVTGSVEFPPFCPCCGAPSPSTTVSAQGAYHTLAGWNTKKIEVPYCSFCAEHARPGSYRSKTNTKPECTTTIAAVRIYVYDYVHVTFMFTSGGYGALFQRANAISVDLSKR